MFDPQWLQLIDNIGFPMVVSFYLLVRVETNIKQLEQVVDELVTDLRKK
ncbi:YvrJ family protein [Priestia megaterium]|nr:YvrJ family protein [Priestia megaterium]